MIIFIWNSCGCLGIFWNDESVLYLNCGGGYISIYICKNPRNDALKMGEFIESKLYLNTVDLKIYKAVFICSNMDGPRDYHTKWSKSERERQIP